MSSFDDIGVAMIPSGYKEDKLYSVLPNDGDGDFDFSRATSATRVNSQGLIEKERANLLTYSNDFNTGYNTSGTIIKTSGQLGYDGFANAWLLEKTTTSAFIWRSFSGSGVYSLSLYAKQGTLNSLFLLITASGGNGDAFFNLSTGVVDAFRNSAFDAQMEDVGNGWYRCSLNGNYSGISQIRIYPAQDESVSINGSIYIQDSQLEQGLVATDVIETTTAAVYEGITDDVPRLDYPIVNGAVRGCPALLLEPQRTNINTQSEYFGASDWNKARMSITDNAVTSPEGVQNAANFVEDSTSNSHPLYDSFTVSSGTSYTVSMFAKKGSRDYFRFNAATSSAIAFFNLANGTVHSGTGIIEDFGNDWYRCSMTFTATSTSETIYIEPSIDGSSAIYQGNGSVSMSIYGFQLEAGSYPTSYIPCMGSSVTRNAEVCDNSGTSGDFNDDEGVLFAEIASLANDGTNRSISISDGSTSNIIVVRFSSIANQINVYVKDGGTTNCKYLSYIK